MMGRIKHLVINYLTKNLLKALTEEDVLHLAKGSYHLGNRTLTSEEVLMLKEEAEAFRKSLLYKVLRRKLIYEAMKRMSTMAQTDGDITFGKAMLYNEHITKKYLENIKDMRV